MKDIIIKNAKENNLKSVSLTIPRDKLVVFTGLSGSGKSSLAFDTIFAEGQRRYMESLSSYARQFLGQMDKPDVESIEGLSPAISIDQKTTSSNPRSTVGTVTEIYDYLRLLFARVGVPYCPHCGLEITKTSVDQICDRVMELPQDTKLLILAPIVRGRKGEFEKLFAQLRHQGFVRVIVDGEQRTLDEEIKLVKNNKHNISVVVDRLVVKPEMNTRLSDSIESALKLAEGLVIVSANGTDVTYSDKFACPNCGFTLEEMEPRSFSFNSPFGACPECAGLGFKQEFDERLILPDDGKSLHEGAIRLLGFNLGAASWMRKLFEALGRKHNFSCDVPVRDLPKSAFNTIMYGNGGEQLVCTLDDGRTYNATWEGIIPMMTRRHAECKSDWTRTEYEKFMIDKPCMKCHGKRLKDEILSVKIAGLNIWDVGELSVEKALEFFSSLQLDDTRKKISYMVLKEINARLKFLVDVGLGYLTLNRAAGTLSGGEAQRIRLATQIGSGLTGVLYILDEPSIGLHQRDNSKLIATLSRLRDIGNTLIVVEHDEDTIRCADFVVDVGPGAGVHGGEIVCAGTVEDVKNCKESITGKYLSGKMFVPVPAERRAGNGEWLTVTGARKNNLKNIDVSFPLGTLCLVTGVSGSGKSSLVNEVLLPYLAEKLNRARPTDVACDGICGIGHLDKVIAIDQSAIGRTPRSNPATYTGVFTLIRDLFAATPDAKERGYNSGRFSFNVKGGRCEHCDGDGILRISMNFLPDVYVPCEVCHGARYNRETLAVKYKGKSIADVLDMTVEEAVHFFENIQSIKNKIQTLYDVGLGYIKLGQPATTLSGGEAQRVKLATELSKRSTGKTVYILDEPTTGLHTHDVAKLITILQRLVATGNTVIVIEHNLDVIKVADYIIDLGPEGGDGGGTVVACGTPEEIAKVKDSYTGQFLAPILRHKKD
ncbi:MAG: excinuclease ABC subunit UvrA [Corallococcus sp.]|nr:excinuclease ABC subunit UvrA [Corallococcus sp.]MCM1359252.1 excinuclease ABC subunit UvrA [Corallococcus sp.]MCM1394643.1 excinuclease ABC subunit UvrA [Corallococcus sp.]